MSMIDSIVWLQYDAARRYSDATCFIF